VVQGGVEGGVEGLEGGREGGAEMFLVEGEASQGRVQPDGFVILVGELESDLLSDGEFLVLDIDGFSGFTLINIDDGNSFNLNQIGSELRVDLLEQSLKDAEE
jgi:hypothetical protein